MCSFTFSANYFKSPVANQLAVSAQREVWWCAPRSTHNHNTLKTHNHQTGCFNCSFHWSNCQQIHMFFHNFFFTEHNLSHTHRCIRKEELQNNFFLRRETTARETHRNSHRDKKSIWFAKRRSTDIHQSFCL